MSQLSLTWPSWQEEDFDIKNYQAYAIVLMQWYAAGGRQTSGGSGTRQQPSEIRAIKQTNQQKWKL